MTVSLRDGSMQCVRHKCNRVGLCQYEHNCKAMTKADMAVAQAKWESDRLHQEQEVAAEAARDREWSSARNAKIERMLEQHDLSLWDLEQWVKEITT